MQRGAVARPVVGEELALEAGDVHADRAFGLARAALETEVQRFVHAVVTQPGFTQSAVTTSGRPMATISRSAWRAMAAGFLVPVWHTVTVASPPGPF